MPQKPIELHYWPTPNGHKITIMLEECGLPYEIKPVNIGKGDQFKPEFLALSPNNRMPAIVDPDGPGGKPISIFEFGRHPAVPRPQDRQVLSGRGAGVRGGRAVAVLADGQPRPQLRPGAPLPQLRAGEDPIRHRPLHQRGAPALRRHERAAEGPRLSRRRLLDRRHGDLPLGAALQEPGPGPGRVPATSRSGSSASTTGPPWPRPSRSARSCGPTTTSPPTRTRRPSCSASAPAAEFDIGAWDERVPSGAPFCLPSNLSLLAQWRLRAVRRFDALGLAQRTLQVTARGRQML